MRTVIGTAGWSVAREAAAAFPQEGSSLERYAARFPGTEINSSFHRPHRPATWRRWAESVPEDFRFSVKLPKTISHGKRLAGCGEELARFLEEAGELGDKLAILLLQLPPSFAFDSAPVEDFLSGLGGRTAARLACEPRHASWFEPEADALLERLGVARVAADPAVVPAAALPGGWRGLAYWRLHGSPVKYRSSYAPALDLYAAAVAREQEAGAETWCIFDNTASSAATGDALALAERLGLHSPGGGSTGGA
ncbi:MAG: DUF72 domain-containing protein [Alphaproteobacteria bacterium]|nr:DUF72 domain-containing protein [Alphaproteobacteria bacterium]MBV9372700.1 DUF72 domain-containing protein [Alphaproteobacteria bacterium]MBV9900675.1 DUF72 domain-containing protein [Alphaproteobacteria bacterium]